MYKLITIQKPTFRARYGKEELVGQLLSTLQFFRRLQRGQPTRVSWIVCKKRLKNVQPGLIHVTDWMPTLASLAGVPKHQIEELNMDGIDQTDMLLKGKNSRRTEFVYNIKTSPFKAGYRMGDYKLLWGEHPKGDWFSPQDDSRLARKLRNKIDWEEIQLKLMENENLIDLEENDWDMEDEKGVPLEDPVGSFDKLTRNQPAMLFDVMEDPEEKRDIAKENPKIVSVMKRRLKEASRTMRAGNFELKSILGHPFLRGGNFMPGWCVPEV